MSAACDNCYAEAMAKRTGHDVWGKTAGRRFLSDSYWAKPLRWQRDHLAGVDAGRVFSGSMCDVFEANQLVVRERFRLWELIDATPALTWQLLTKRPENIKRFAPAHWMADWPAHVWLGTTVEDERLARIRVPRLLAVPGVAVRFLSMEPLLGPVDIWPWLDGGIGWVIVGGESGPRHRALNLDHARSLRDQCAEAGVPFFFKQVGGAYPTAGGDQLDGVAHKYFPVTS